MDQKMTDAELLADMRTLNQEHLPDGYPCVQTWQIARLIAMIDERRDKVLSLIMERDRWQMEAEKKFSLRREIEEILGVTNEPCSDGQFERGIEAARKMRERRDELDYLLHNLLAIIHRDGGQYAQVHGDKKATADAIELIGDLRVAFHDGEAI